MFFCRKLSLDALAYTVDVCPLQASTISVAGLTAWNALDAYHATAGKTVLLQGILPILSILTNMADARQGPEALALLRSYLLNSLVSEPLSHLHPMLNFKKSKNWEPHSPSITEPTLTGRRKFCVLLTMLVLIWLLT